MSHTLRFCRLDEAGLLQDYIAKEWRADHIFVLSREVLDFQYLDRKNSRYNVLAAYNETTREFDGILGFTLLSQYDENLHDAWVWTSIWSAKKAYPSLGLKLYRHLFERLGLKDTSTAGLSGDSVKFCQLFYDRVGKLSHFYIKNEAKKHFKLAQFSPILPPPVPPAAPSPLRPASNSSPQKFHSPASLRAQIPAAAPFPSSSPPASPPRTIPSPALTSLFLRKSLQKFLAPQISPASSLHEPKTPPDLAPSTPPPREEFPPPPHRIPREGF
ncbi:MAG: hypothetical protein Q4A73_06845, partial [Campylobacter sp.]|nr:hypothetical protein [Campylobacter sp.]